MIYNGENLKTGEIEANYGYLISIKAKDRKLELILGFQPKVCNFRDMSIGKSIDLIDYLYWDTTLVVDESYYLFDITKDKVILTKLEDNKFKIDVNIENPDMIYSPLGEDATFKSLIIDDEFSFNYDYKPNE